MDILKARWKEFSILTLLLLLVAQWRSPRVEKVEVEKVVERVVEVEKVVIKYVDRKTTKTVTKPDGTVIVVRQEEVKQQGTQVKAKEEAKEESRESRVSAPASRYSLSVHTSQLSYPSTVLVGARIGNLPVFIEAGGLNLLYQPAFSLGLRVEF